MSLTLHSDLTGAGTDVLTLHPEVGHELSFFLLFLLGHSSYVGAVFSTRGMQLFTFNCMELGEGDMRSPVGLCIGLVAVMRRAYLSMVLND